MYKRGILFATFTKGLLITVGMVAMRVNEGVLCMLTPFHVSVCTSTLAALSVLFGLGVAYLHANRTISKQVSRGVSEWVGVLRDCCPQCWCRISLCI